MSERTTIIFGNGLGMALEPNYFELKKALSYVWETSTELTGQHKALIKSALPEMAVDGYPESEEMLNELHVAIIATEILSGYETERVAWLNDNSRDVPEAFKKFVHEVALYFHSSDKSLPIDFVSSLSSYIQQTKSHVGVLNYDNLLYDALCRTHILKGYSGTLIDGFLSTSGFAAENMDRMTPKKLGWFP